MNDETPGDITKNGGTTSGEELFHGELDPDAVLEGKTDDEESDDSATMDGDDSDERNVPLFDESLKAPWEGSEERWLAGEETETATLREAPARDEQEQEEDRVSMPDGLPSIPMAYAPREMTRGHRTAVFGVVVLVLCLLGAGAWILDLRDETAHQDKLIQALDDRLDARLRQIAALRESSEARARELEERIADLSGMQDPTARKWVDQMRRNLDQARRDVELADETIAGQKLDDKIKEAGTEKTRRETELAMKLAGVEPDARSDSPEEASAEPSGDESNKPQGEVEAQAGDLDELLAGAVGDKALVPPQEKTADENRENTLPDRGATDSLPSKPTREQVRASMNLVVPRVKACAGGKEGRVLVRVGVLGTTGRVIDAEVIDDQFKGTAVASCVARAVKLAKFPPFATERMSIKYPFDL